MANKFFRPVLGLLVVIVGFTSAAISQTPDQKRRDTCRGSECSAMSRAELFVKTFASSGDLKGLRTSDLEQEERVKNAFYGIDATRLEVERGQMTEQDGNLIIDGHKQVIRNYVYYQNLETTGSAAIRYSVGRLRKSLKSHHAPNKGMRPTPLHGASHES